MIIRTASGCLKFRYKRNCLYKKDYNYFFAIIKCVIVFIKNKKLLSIYNCPFKKHYHVGNKSKNSERRLQYAEKYAKLTLHYYEK